MCVHSSINGCVGCLHLLAIMNDAAMNIGIQIFVLLSILSILLGLYPEVETLDYTVALHLIF